MQFSEAQILLCNKRKRLASAHPSFSLSLSPHRVVLRASFFHLKRYGLAHHVIGRRGLWRSECYYTLTLLHTHTHTLCACVSSFLSHQLPHPGRKPVARSSDIQILLCSNKGAMGVVSHTLSLSVCFKSFEKWNANWMTLNSSLKKLHRKTSSKKTYCINYFSIILQF